MSLDQIHARIAELGKRTRRRTLGGYVTCVLVVLACAWWLLQFDNSLQRTGTLFILAGIGTLLLQLRAKDRPRFDPVRQRGERDPRPPAAMGDSTSFTFLRREIERQLDFHRGQQLLSRMLPLISGPALFLAGFAQAHPEIARPIALQAVLVLVLIVLALLVNRWHARRYQQQLDALDRIAGAS